MDSVSVCQARFPGSSPVQFVCFRKVEFHQHAIDLSHQCCRLVKQRLCPVLSCLCDNVCKRSLAICRKSGASCPISSLLSALPIWPARTERDVNIIQIQKSHCICCSTSCSCHSSLYILSLYRLILANVGRLSLQKVFLDS